MKEPIFKMRIQTERYQAALEDTLFQRVSGTERIFPLYKSKGFQDNHFMFEDYVYDAQHKAIGIIWRTDCNSRCQQRCQLFAGAAMQMSVRSKGKDENGAPLKIEVRYALELYPYEDAPENLNKSF